MIAKFTRIYVRHYSDNGDTKAYAEWIDGRGTKGRTEGGATYHGRPHHIPTYSFGTHMHALFAAAKRQGLRLERETW